MKNLAKTLCVVCLFTTQTFAKSPPVEATQTQSQAQQADECPYDFPNAKSALDAKSKDFSLVKKIIKNNKEKVLTQKAVFKKAIEMLKATPTTVEGQALTKTLIEALESAAMNKIFRPPNASYDVPCGDAQCNLDASVKETLKASYSFAL